MGYFLVGCLLAIAVVYSDAQTVTTVGTTLMTTNAATSTTSTIASSTSTSISNTVTSDTTTSTPAASTSLTTTTETTKLPESTTITPTTTPSASPQTTTSTASQGSGDVPTSSTEIETTNFAINTAASISTEQTTPEPSTTSTPVTTSASGPTTTTESITTPEPITTQKLVPTTAKTTTATSDSTSIVLAIILSLFGIVLILFLVVLYRYCTGKPLPCLGRKHGGHEIIEMPQRKASHVPKFVVGHMVITREEFEGQYKRKVADDGRGYREEFKALHTESSTMSVARDPINVQKNRYDNVVPWDTTRVVLSVSEGGKDSDDYINANFVPGYLAEKKFIACQGPKESTCTDFWRMIWDQKSATIVMTTNLVEAKKPKCDQYWPGDDASTGESETYGEFVVTKVDVKVRNYYVARTFKLEKLDEPLRMIRQLHYTHWPDFGVPKNPHELLLFRRRVLAANPPHSGPIVVHCSAGVGRTGTFILIDAAMEQLQAEGKVDLFSFLTKMRKYRMMLVQTDAQYVFAHSAILQHINYGDTEVSVKKFRTQVHSLRDQEGGSDETILEEQFSSLLKVQSSKDNMKHGRSSIKKNRVLQIIPFDDNRVTLPRKPGQEKSDYINGSFIDGFKDQSAYIATQGPLADTAADFWSMVWVYEAQNIVMLTGLVEKGHEMCVQYWPDELNDEKEFGDISVKYVSKDDDDVVDYVVREFLITNSAAVDEPDRTVRQFHYTGWPEVGLPSDAHGMIEIANRLTSKDKDGYNRPTIVHCSSGGGRTGVFVALNILMEQADAEGLVDVFQTVKSLRSQRPHIIQTKEQLYFCYAALLQHLETNQLAGDNTTLTSNINSSIGDQSESVVTSNTGIPTSSFLRAENTTPQGSMNNKLDANSVTDPGSASEERSGAVDTTSYGDNELDDGNAELDATIVEIQSPSAGSGDSVNQALLKDDNGASLSSHSDFEIVNETNGQDAPVTV